MLQMLGCECQVAENGRRGLEAWRNGTWDLVLMDCSMPEMDGYEVCRRLKADQITAEIPVIFLTAKVEIEDEEKGFDVGAVDYIAKPISPPILKARVRTHLMLKGARDYLKDQNAYLEQELERRLRLRLQKPDA